MNTRLQILVDKKIKARAEDAFADFGLNLSEGIRFLLSSFVNGKAKVDFSNDDEYIVLSEEKKKEYDEMDEDIRLGRNVFKLDQNKDFHSQIMAIADED